MLTDVIHCADFRYVSVPSRATQGSVGREPTSTDVNFNSPDHQISSQDGSFIQDEDMQLILEFGSGNQHIQHRQFRGLLQQPQQTAQFGGGGAYPFCFSSRSWLGKQTQHATDFDANVAELDFDNFVTKDILTFGATKYADFNSEVYTLDSCTAPEDRRVLNIPRNHQRYALCGYNDNVINQNHMESSDISLSGGRSLFASSCAADGDSIFGNVEEVFGTPMSFGGPQDNGVICALVQPTHDEAGDFYEDEIVAATAVRNNGGFISTDSLNLSSYIQQQEELLRKVCVTNKRDYMLTFDNKLGRESGIISAEDSDYQDAFLSDASDRSFAGHRQQLSDSLPGANDNNLISSNSFTTWGRIKRSYDHGRPHTEIYSSKCTSLPNLQNSPSHAAGDGAGEQMFGGSGGEEGIKIYDVMSASSSRSMPRHHHLASNRLSLLRVFKNRIPDPTVLDNLDLLASHSQEDGASLNVQQQSGTSSGYATCAGGGIQQDERDSPAQTANNNNNEPDAEATLTRQNVRRRTTVTSGARSKPGSCSTFAVPPEVHSPSADYTVRDFVPVDDWQYGEVYVDGRYIDVNHNEVGYSPSSTAPFQNVKENELKQEHTHAAVEEAFSAATNNSKTSPRRRQNRQWSLEPTSPPRKPPRTFASLLNLREVPLVKTPRASDAVAYVGCSQNHLSQREEDHTAVAQMRDSATQVPAYVVDQSVQTCACDDGKLITVVTTSIREPVSNKPIYVSKTVALSTQTSQSADYFYNSGLPGPSYSIDKAPTSSRASNARQRPERRSYDLPDLGFMKLPPFSIPPLFPNVVRFPATFCNSDAPYAYSWAPPEMSSMKAPSFANVRDPLAELFANAACATIATNPLHLNAAVSRTTHVFTPLLATTATTTIALPDPPTRRYRPTTAVTVSTECHNTSRPKPAMDSTGPGPSSTTTDCLSRALKMPARDSGFCSADSGPQHISDWDSLQFLLPKEVVQTYSFFKANANLLGSSSNAGKLRSDQDAIVSLAKANCAVPASTTAALNIDKPLKTSSHGHQKRSCHSLSKRSGKHVRPRTSTGFEDLCSCQSDRFGSVAQDLHCHKNSRIQHNKHQRVSCASTSRSWYVPCSVVCHNTRAPCCMCPASLCHHCCSCTCGKHNYAGCCKESRVSNRRVPSQNNANGLPVKEHDAFCVVDSCKRCAYRHKMGGRTVGREIDSCCQLDEQMDSSCSSLESSATSSSLSASLCCAQLEEENDESSEEVLDIIPRDEQCIHSEYAMRMLEVEPHQFVSLPSFAELCSYNKSVSGGNLLRYKQKQLNLNQLDSAQLSSNSLTACATCFRVRSPSVDAISTTVLDNGDNFCDCKTSDIVDIALGAQQHDETTELFHSASHNRPFSQGEVCKSSSADVHQKTSKCRGSESFLNTELFCQKRDLIYAVTKASDELMLLFSKKETRTVQQMTKLVSDAVRYSLCVAIEAVVADGLHQTHVVWDVVCASATPGPVTKNIHELVVHLNSIAACHREDETLRFFAFIVGLLNLHSLDCWFSYLVLKDKVLCLNYSDTSFLRMATNCCCSLFTQLVKALQPLALLPFDQLKLTTAPPLPFSPARTANLTLQPVLNFTFHTPSTSAAMDAPIMKAQSLPPLASQHDTEPLKYLFAPARLPRDSRVPKSSSVPSRLQDLQRGWQSLNNSTNPFLSGDTGSSSSMKSRSVDDGLYYFSAGSSVPTTESSCEEANISPQQQQQESSGCSIPSRIPVAKRKVGKSAAAKLASKKCGTPQRPIKEWDTEAANLSSNSSSVPDDSESSDSPTFVCATEDHFGNDANGELTFYSGDTMSVLKAIGCSAFMCQRGQLVGLVPRSKVTYVTFL